MATKDFILQNLDQLPENLWQEVLDFILFLRYKQQIVEALEDAEDVADAKAALAEPGFITLAEVKKELG
jgi:predicted oxidoreductase